MKIKPLFKQNETPTISEYLKRCGVDNPEQYDNPPASVVESPYKYNNMEDGIEILEQAIATIKNNTNKFITIICDSDCDGYCATTIACQFLKSCGLEDKNIDVVFHTTKQHGLSKDIMVEFDNESWERMALLWIPDAGTNDETACAYISSYWNIPILITDHHDFSRENHYATIINNQDGLVDNKALCGAGVTHKLITAYCKKHDMDFHQGVLDLVALATIGDVCDMRSMENRLIVRWGIRHINNSFLANMIKTFISDSEITPHNLAWNVIPKINAVCRSDNDDLKAYMFDAMSTYCWDKNLGVDMYEVIDLLKKQHQEQSEESKRLYEKAIKGEHHGEKVKIFAINKTPYTGLVANKLAEHYACPCMVVHNEGGIFMGSLRSPYPMRTRLQNSTYMTICAGHEASCGVGWYVNDTPELLDYCEKLELEEPTKDVMYHSDDALIQQEVFEITELGKEYWGTGIPEPTIHISNIAINGQDIKEIGANKTTIKWLYGDIEFIKFFTSAEQKEQLNVGRPVPMVMEIIGTPSINRWRDRETKQIVIKEWEIK